MYQGLKRFLNLPMIFLILVLLVFFFGDSLSYESKASIYSISLLIKDLIIFILPIIIFSFVLSGLTQLKSESIKVILILLPLVCISNFAGFWTSYIFAMPILKTGLITISKLTSANELVPNLDWHIPSIIKNDMALLVASAIGLVGIFGKIEIISTIGEKLSVVANVLLKKVICPILPLFVLGFIIKMQYEGTLGIIAKQYFFLLIIVGILTYGYMGVIIYFLSGRKVKATLNKFKNLLPGVMIGMFSMSSAAAIPSTIEGSEKNLKNPSIARFVVPATANMHLLGDCFALPIIGLALMVSFGYELPSPYHYLIFSLYGVLAKFAAAGIPGGSAIILAPVFESVFGFNVPMLTAVTAIYVFFDPVATSSNVFGHGMFAMLFEKVFDKFSKKRG